MPAELHLSYKTWKIFKIPELCQSALITTSKSNQEFKDYINPSSHPPLSFLLQHPTGHAHYTKTICERTPHVLPLSPSLKNRTGRAPCAAASNLGIPREHWKPNEQINMACFPGERKMDEIPDFWVNIPLCPSLIRPITGDKHCTKNELRSRWMCFSAGARLSKQNNSHDMRVDGQVPALT